MNSRRQWPLARDLRASAFRNYSLAYCLSLAKKAARSRVLRTWRRQWKKLGKKTPSGETSASYLHKYDFLLLAFVRLMRAHTHRSSAAASTWVLQLLFLLFLALRVFFEWLTDLFNTLGSAVSKFHEFTDFALFKVYANIPFAAIYFVVNFLAFISNWEQRGCSMRIMSLRL